MYMRCDTRTRVLIELYTELSLVHVLNFGFFSSDMMHAFLGRGFFFFSKSRSPDGLVHSRVQACA